LALILAGALVLFAEPCPGGVTHFPGTFDGSESPPVALSGQRVARATVSRVLHVEAGWHRYQHPNTALRSDDPRTRSLSEATVQRWAIDLTQGLPVGFAAHARLSWLDFEVPGAGFETGGSSERGFGDLITSASYASGVLGRSWLRVEGGMRWPTGSTRVLVDDSGGRSTPFTTGQNEFFGSAQSSVMLSGGGGGAAFHVHAAATYAARKGATSGHGFLPYPDRLPLVALDPDGTPYDRLDLRFGVSFNRGANSVFATIDLPLLLDASDRLQVAEVPRTVTPGFRIAALAGLGIEVSADVHFATDRSNTAFDPLAAYPEWGLRVAVATNLVPLDSDRDGDTIGDLSDACPTRPEDRDGFADRDGCPDPDNDDDGVPDIVDVCPDAAEDLDGYQDRDGCPELDNDGDGIEDGVDGCPSVGEDFDGYADEDGCPDYDNDGDGLADDVDACPDEAEDPDGHEDEDGCPDPDGEEGEPAPSSAPEGEAGAPRPAAPSGP
jgi:hypothetical protein